MFIHILLLLSKIDSEIGDFEDNSMIEASN